MSEIKFTACGANAVCVSTYALDKLLKEADGTLSLLYLRILREGAGFSLETAAASLNLTSQETEKAILRLTALGLILPVTDKALASAPEVPEYSANDVADRGGNDLGFRIVVSETQRIFGRMLSSQELKQLFGIYDHLGLPSEVMLMLVNHCVADYREKFGPGRLPSLRSIEKEGIVWADLEILTLDQAEEYTRRQRERSGTLYELKRAIGVASREFSASEKKYAESWLELGFPVEALSIAYDRTVMKTGSLKWSYMNSIIKNWHEKNLHTPAEIKEGDSLKGFRRAPPVGEPSPPDSPLPAPDSSEELNRTKKIINMIRNG